MRLRECRVLEIGDSPAGAYAGKLFAQLGAEVVKIEAPAVEAPRRRERGGGVEGGAVESGAVESVARAAYLDAGKRSLALDLAAADGRRELGRLAAGADVLIESASPGSLAPMSRSIDTSADAPRLVRVWISPFGRSGPYAGWRSNEFTDDALSGHLYLNGEKRREPLARPGLHACCQAGAHAFLGALAALYARERGGRGQTVEVTHLMGLASLHQYTTVMWTHARHRLGRDGNRQGGHYHPVGSYPCRDGWVCLAMPISDMLLPFLAEAGLHDVAADPRFVEDFTRGQHKDEFDAAIAPWLLDHTVREVVEIGLRAHAPIGPVLSALDVVADPHHEARGFFLPVRVGDREWLYPRGPFRISGVEPRLGPQPELGEANREGIEWALHTFEDLESRGSGSDRQPGEDETPAPEGSFPRSFRAGPLTGVRVLDLTRVWAGPLAARLLGDLGADVIKIEAAWARGSGEVPAAAGPATHLYPDDDVGDRPWNREISFGKLNRNKRGVTLELDRPRGRELFLRLVETADVVIENFTPRVMGKLGLDPAALQAVHPRLVCVSMPGFGSTGPYRDWLAFGPLIEAMSGQMARMGYADGGPCRSGLAWPDPVTALHAASATVAALLARGSAPARRGPVVEVPMLESMICFVGDEILAAQARGAPSPRRGNRHAERAPQGVYPCAGSDRWIAISVTSDDEWRALWAEASLDDAWPAACTGAGLDPATAGAGLAERQRRHDEIDRALAAWTSRQEPDALMRRLQECGVIAATVADAERLVDDPQLAHDGFWVELEHREIGRRRYPGIALRFSETPATFRRAAPCLGQHNREVLGGELGLAPEEIDTLEREGVIADRPPPGASFRRTAHAKQLAASSGPSPEASARK